MTLKIQNTRIHPPKKREPLPNGQRISQIKKYRKIIKVLKVLKSANLGWKLILYVKLKKYFIDTASSDVKSVRSV